jgi:hypothetical protein
MNSVSRDVHRLSCWARDHPTMLVPERGDPIMNTGLLQISIVTRDVSDVSDPEGTVMATAGGR